MVWWSMRERSNTKCIPPPGENERVHPNTNEQILSGELEVGGSGHSGSRADMRE